METRVCTWTGLCFSLFPLVTFVAQIAVLARAGLVLTEHSRSLSPRPGQGPLNSVLSISLCTWSPAFPNSLSFPL